MSHPRQPKNAPKGKDGKGTGGQFVRDLSGADPRNIPTASPSSLPPADTAPTFDYDALEKMRAGLPSPIPVNLFDSVFAPTPDPTPQELRHQEALKAKNLPQRIVHEEIPWGPDSTGNFLLHSYGYDEATGRLEVLVEDSADSSGKTLYAYCGVTREDYQEFRFDPCMRWETDFLNNSNYAYADADEAALAGVADRCDDCGQYKSSTGHSCPAVAFAHRLGNPDRLWTTVRLGFPCKDPYYAGKPNQEEAPYIFPEEGYSVPNWDNIDEALASSPDIKYVELSLSLSMRAKLYGIVEGAVRYSRQDDGDINVDVSQLTCSCLDYRDHGDCIHITAYHMIAENGLHPERGISTTKAQEEELIRLTEHIPEDVSWIDNDDMRAEAFRLHRTDTDLSYTRNPNMFLTDMEQSRQINLPEGAIVTLPYRTENVLDGLGTRQLGQGFGVELEYEFPPSWTVEKCQAANERIGIQLYEAGLTHSSTMQPYGSAGKNGYPTEHTDKTGRGTWSWEHDGSVEGELITPTMFDEPETWVKLATALRILRDNGAIAGGDTGSHVHVGTGSYKGSPAAYTELIRIVNQHEDSIVRLATNPTRGKHRNNTFARPLATVAPQGFATVASARRAQDIVGGRETIINLKSCFGGHKDHVEFRIFDGSLDPGTVQANILLAVGTVEAARRSAEAGGTSRGKELWGAGQARATKRQTEGKERISTPEETIEDSRTLMSFLDTICRRKEDKAQLAAVAAHTSWPDPPE